jgi:hypothetical protein
MGRGIVDLSNGTWDRTGDYRVAITPDYGSSDSTLAHAAVRLLELAPVIPERI